ADPADGAADGEERQCRAVVELQHASEGDEGEVDGRFFAGDGLPRFRRGARERHLGRFREALAEELEDQRGARIAGWIERMAEAVERLAAAEAVGHGLAHVARAAALVAHRLPPRAHGALLGPLDRGEAGPDAGLSARA